MPVQILDDPPPERTLAEKLVPWLRRSLIGGCLVWICVSMQTFLEDARTHTIKVSYPLLGNYERITAPQPGFDPRTAQWRALSTGFAVPDGAIFFVKAGGATYAVKMLRQTIQPETAGYEFLTVGGNAPVTKAVAEGSSGGLDLPACRINWSGKSKGAGYLYLDDAFIWNKTPRFRIGVPFQSGDLEPFRKAVPTDVHFESQPWRIEAATSSETIMVP